MAATAALPWFGARHRVVLLGFFGWCNLYAMRVNLSVGSIKMAKQYDWCGKNATSGSQSCATTGAVLGSFFYGYILSQIAGGRVRFDCAKPRHAMPLCPRQTRPRTRPRLRQNRPRLTAQGRPAYCCARGAAPRSGHARYLATRFGGKHVFGVGVLATSVLTIATPLAASAGVPVIISARPLRDTAGGSGQLACRLAERRWAGCAPVVSAAPKHALLHSLHPLSHYAHANHPTTPSP